MSGPRRNFKANSITRNGFRNKFVGQTGANDVQCPVFATTDTAETRFENDPEGVAFEYEVVE